MDLSILNKEQKEAVLYNDGPLLIIAGAGSGKTRVITYKVAYLIDSGINPANILAITFTNKASDEMKERIESLVPDSSKRIFVSTFHKFCGRILRNFIESIGYNRNFTIYDTEDTIKVIKKIIKDLNYDEKVYKAKKMAKYISNWKNHDIGIEEANKEVFFGNRICQVAAEIYKEYQSRMFKSNAIDFDDMLLLTVRVLSENEEARRIITERFNYILIDEYQDTNLVQFKIVELLIKQTSNNLTVVGDDDQSIYRFRGADITNILEFERCFHGAKVIKLTQNYRSTNNILKVANSVIKNNIERKGKELWSNNGDGEKVIFTEYYSDDDEAKNIVNNIKKFGEYKNTAVLYRTNAQSKVFEDKLMEFNIPYLMIGGVPFYRRKEVKDILAYLSIIVNSSDNNSLLRIINVPKRGIGDATIDKIQIFADEKNISLYDALLRIGEIDISDRIKEKVNNIINLISDLKKETDVYELISRICNDFYLKYLNDEYDDEELVERKSNIERLITDADKFKEKFEMRAVNDFLLETNFSMIAAYIENMALKADTDSIDSTSEKVTLMTLHASKGLEYKYVYLTGMNDRIFPSCSEDGVVEDIEEERRVCYVGLTRAKEYLFLSSARNRKLYGKKPMEFGVSCFIDEIDNNLIVKNKLRLPAFDNDYNGSEFWGYGKRKNKGFSYNQEYKNNYSQKKITKFNNINTSRIDLKKSIDSYKTGANIEKATSLDYKVGDKVSHVKFGTGKVLKIEDIGRDYEVTVDFEDVGIKTMFAAFAKLKK